MSKFDLRRIKLGDRISLIEDIRQGSKKQEITYIENGEEKILIGTPEEIIETLNRINTNPKTMKWTLIKNLGDG